MAKTSAFSKYSQFVKYSKFSKSAHLSKSAHFSRSSHFSKSSHFSRSPKRDEFLLVAWTVVMTALGSLAVAGPTLAGPPSAGASATRTIAADRLDHGGPGGLAQSPRASFQ